MTYEEWHETAEVVQPTAQVGPSWSNHSRSYWVMDGMHVWEDDVLPHNVFKTPSAYVSVDLQLQPTPFHFALAKKHGGDLVECPYAEDGRRFPQFCRTTVEYKNDEPDAHMRRAFAYIQEYKEYKENKDNEDPTLL